MPRVGTRQGGLLDAGKKNESAGISPGGEACRLLEDVDLSNHSGGIGGRTRFRPLHSQPLLREPLLNLVHASGLLDRQAVLCQLALELVGASERVSGELNR